MQSDQKAWSACLYRWPQSQILYTNWAGCTSSYVTDGWVTLILGSIFWSVWVEWTRWLLIDRCCLMGGRKGMCEAVVEYIHGVIYLNTVPLRKRVWTYSFTDNVSTPWIHHWQWWSLPATRQSRGMSWAAKTSWSVVLTGTELWTLLR